MRKASWGSLQKLVGALPIEQFFVDYWEQRALLVRGSGSPALGELSRTLFSFDHVDQLLSVGGPRFRDFIRMSRGGHPIPRDDYSVVRTDGLVDFNVEKVLSLYADGATITINRAHQCSSELAALCSDLSRELRAHVNANVYITPPNSQGFAVHSDTHDVFLLQVEGRKRWRIQETLEYLATPRHPNVASDPVAAGRSNQFDLVVGDAVYMPRGLLHEGTSDDSHSMHITLGIHPYTWADLVRDVLSRAEATETVLRRAVTPSPDDFDTTLRTVTASLTSHLSSSDSVQSILSANTMPYEADSHRGRFRKLTDRGPITLAMPMRARRGSDTQLEKRDDEVVLTIGTKSLVFPPYVSPHLHQILESAQVTGEELPRDLDDEGKLTLLRRLLSEGVLEIAQT
jgi:ribosomal protein L16 Arg81 hydroxylase